MPEANLPDHDIEWVRTFYPELEPDLPELHPFESQRLRLSPGQQGDFAVRLDATREYMFQTFGHADTVLVFFEHVGEGEDVGSPVPRGDDDSGTDRNAAFDGSSPRSVDAPADTGSRVNA